MRRRAASSPSRRGRGRPLPAITPGVGGTWRIDLEDLTGALLLESGDYLLLESSP